MIRNTVRAIVATVVLAVLTGLIYPLVMTGFAQVAFHSKANGSAVQAGGRVVGSSLIGQLWTGPQWFYGRPSAISSPYDASTSSGSNLGPLSRALADEIKKRIAAIMKVDGPYHPRLKPSGIPVDLLTASASGLDPDISSGGRSVPGTSDRGSSPRLAGPDTSADQRSHRGEDPGAPR